MLARVPAHLRDDDHPAAQAATFGLVGDGAGLEFPTWRDQADLPDTAAVVADPSIVDWAARPEPRLGRAVRCGRVGSDTRQRRGLAAGD